MEKAQRTGSDRRSSLETSHSYKRTGEDRRMALRHALDISGIFEKTTVFSGLEVRELKKILSVCSKHIFCKGTVIYQAGEESSSMFILLKGKLKMTFPDRNEGLSIVPITIVGDRGVFTDDKRSTTVVADEDCILLTVYKTELFRVLHYDGELGMKVFMNVIRDIAKQLRENNVIIDEQRQVNLPDDYYKILEKILSYRNNV